MLEATSAALMVTLQDRSALLVFSSLVGVLIGMRFKVLTLLPITGLGVAMVAANAAIQNESAPSALAAMILVTVGLQLGYLAGAGIRFLAVGLWQRASWHKSSLAEVDGEVVDKKLRTTFPLWFCERRTRPAARPVLTFTFIEAERAGMGCFSESNPSRPSHISAGAWALPA